MGQEALVRRLDGIVEPQTEQLAAAGVEDPSRAKAQATGAHPGHGRLGSLPGSFSGAGAARRDYKRPERSNPSPDLRGLRKIRR